MYITSVLSIGFAFGTSGAVSPAVVRWRRVRSCERLSVAVPKVTATADASNTHRQLHYSCSCSSGRRSFPSSRSSAWSPWPRAVTPVDHETNNVYTLRFLYRVRISQPITFGLRQFQPITGNAVVRRKIPSYRGFCITSHRVASRFLVAVFGRGSPPAHPTPVAH